MNKPEQEEEVSLMITGVDTRSERISDAHTVVHTVEALTNSDGPLNSYRLPFQS